MSRILYATFLLFSALRRGGLWDLSSRDGRWSNLEDLFKQSTHLCTKMQMVISQFMFFLVLTSTLATRCFATTWSPPAPAKEGYVCPFSCWRPSLRFVEYERPSWIYCLLSNLQKMKQMYFKWLTDNNNDKKNHIPSGNAWERRVLTSSSGTTHSISNVLVPLLTTMWTAGGSAICIRAVDNPTLPVNLRFSHLFNILAEC